MEHSLVKFIQELPVSLLSFKIVLTYHIEFPEEEAWSKSFTFEKGDENKGTVIGCKSLNI